MANAIDKIVGFHEVNDAQLGQLNLDYSVVTSYEKFTYKFENFFHPYVGRLVEELNKESLSGMLDPKFHLSLEKAFFNSSYTIPDNRVVDIDSFPKEIDVREGGPYANYNWELLFHIPLTIAVHLSKNQRFAEAQRWFHHIFDPTCNDTSIDPPMRYWKFIRFRQEGDVTQVDELLRLLSLSKESLSSEEEQTRDLILEGYNTILRKPFRPHAVARTRHVAYQYNVVMKYLDNQIAWGDHLFRQDTIESINEATQRYVLAANILGPRPQRIPRKGATRPRTFAELKEKGLDELGNALVDLEVKFPFNSDLPQTETIDSDTAESLFGIGRSLYFCVPRNEKLLRYWDTVADRLFKIRNCMNIEGVVRQLALFDPPIDPGMLVKAAAAGIDIGSIVSGLNQPIGPTRSLFLIQKAIELAGEVRGLGNALLSAIEKGDGERMTLLRQSHEIKIQEMTQEVRFLQWKQTEESTKALLGSRTSVLERYNYYRSLLGLEPDNEVVPEELTAERGGLTEESFDEVYSTLVEKYEKAIPTIDYAKLSLADESSPAVQSSAVGSGNLYLSSNENAELNEHIPASRDHRIAATVSDSISQVLALMPDFGVDLHFWGLGGNSKIIGGSTFAAVGRIVASSLNTSASYQDSLGSSASRTGSYERRANEWILQANLAAEELMQIGRQITGSLISEQIAHHEYQNIKKQIENSNEVDQFLRDKFTNEELYNWMQGEISRLYYEYYRFAFDTARRAEQTMKRELMRPEIDSRDFIKFNYWDSGRKGLLSGDALYLDCKRLEMAYHEYNKREYELTRNVSLRQLNPLSLLTLKATGSCEVTVPEWLFDMDCPGHYMRRLKNVSLTIPCVTGPYTGVNCTLTLLKSSLRKSSLLTDGEYPRQSSEDERFIDYFSAVQSIVTSGANNDSGLFETNLRDERFLPFEGCGAMSTWKLELPAESRQFDYDTISDVILHIRYTARQGGLKEKAIEHLNELVNQANTSELALLFSLKQDFSAEWHKFVTGNESLSVDIKRDQFSYISPGRDIILNAISIHAISSQNVSSSIPSNINESTLIAFSDALNDKENEGFELILDEDGEILRRSTEANVFIVLKYTLENG